MLMLVVFAYIDIITRQTLKSKAMGISLFPS
jgi:hypothetical protein